MLKYYPRPLRISEWNNLSKTHFAIRFWQTYYDRQNAGLICLTWPEAFEVSLNLCWSFLQMLPEGRKRNNLFLLFFKSLPCVHLYSNKQRGRNQYSRRQICVRKPKTPFFFFSNLMWIFKKKPVGKDFSTWVTVIAIETQEKWMLRKGEKEAKKGVGNLYYLQLRCLPGKQREINNSFWKAFQLWWFVSLAINSSTLELLEIIQRSRL